jgi:hypothetical protein
MTNKLGVVSTKSVCAVYPAEKHELPSIISGLAGRKTIYNATTPDLVPGIPADG